MPKGLTLQCEPVIIIIEYKRTTEDQRLGEGEIRK